MWAVQFDDYGAPDVLRLGTAATPVAGAGQVLVRVAAAGVNPADYKWRSGMLDHLVQLNFPAIVGYDVAGHVAAIGPGVTRFAIGDPVVATVAQGYAEYAVAADAACAHLPEDIGFAQAAALPCPALTGVQMIEDGVRPQPGQTLLVTGATGGVGRFAVAAALALGARVVAAVRPAYADAARAIGAHEILALDGTGRMPACDHAADTVGGADAARLCAQVAPGGAVITVSTTPMDPADLARPAAFFAYRADGARLARIVADVARGVVAMPVAHRLAFVDAAAAHRLMEAGGAGGRIVLEA